MMKYNTIQALISGILNKNICPIKARIIRKNKEYKNNLYMFFVVNNPNNVLYWIDNEKIKTPKNGAIHNIHA